MFGRNPTTRVVVENEISSIKIAIFIAEMESVPSITLGAPVYAIRITENYPLNNFHWILAKKLTEFQKQIIESLAYYEENYV